MKAVQTWADSAFLVRVAMCTAAATSTCVASVCLTADLHVSEWQPHNKPPGTILKGSLSDSSSLGNGQHLCVHGAHRQGPLAGSVRACVLYST